MKKILLPLRFYPLLFFMSFAPGLLFQSCNHAVQKPIRILTGGIQHESNTFNPLLTTENYFVVKRGNDALENEAWADYLKNNGVEIIPTLHADAGPFGVVEKQTYEKFRNEILEGIKKAGHLDGIYLEMHGALHVQGYDDAQADLIKRIRALTGNDVIIAGSFDLHGNISGEFVKGLNILTAYRTAPHIDMEETKLRAVSLLLNAIKNHQHPVIIHMNVPVLIPGEKGITSVEPLRSIYQKLPSIGKEDGLLDASVFVGMPWTDVYRAGMSVQVVASDSSFIDKARKECQDLAEAIWTHRKDLIFDVPACDLKVAVDSALVSGDSTVFITDSGDNTTAGAAGDNTTVLSYFLERNIKDAVIAGIVDSAAVHACVKAGVGGHVSLTIGGKIDRVFGKPLKINGIVRFIAPDTVRGQVHRHPVVVEVNGIQLVLLNVIRSFTSPADFKEVNINPLAHKIVVVKLGYLFQDLRDIAPKTYMALTPGFAYQVIEKLPYKNVRRPIYPLDADMEWTPAF